MAPSLNTLPPRDPDAVFRAALAEPGGYRAQLEKLAALSPWRTERLAVSLHGDNELTAVEGGLFAQEASRLAAALARDVAGGRWQPLPGRMSVAKLDKERVVYRFEALDFCVHGVVAQAIAGLLARRLSPCVHSYQKGRSSLFALRSFSKFIRNHAKARPDPRTRGIFILRRDIKACGDSISLRAGSPLWAQLRALLSSSSELALIEQVVRPLLQGESGGQHQNIRGLPTGSPINNVMLNLHLMPIDEVLADIEGGFYARFGDDFLFAHADGAVVREASARVDAQVAALGLAIHPSKRRNLWLNGAGRPSPHGEFISVQEVPFLGAAVTHRGNLRLPAAKVSALMGELEKRLKQTARLLRAGPVTEEDELKVLCGIVAEALDRKSVFAAPHLCALLEEVDDRAQLHDLDQRLSALVLELVRGTRNKRVMRGVPVSRLRALGLPSLVLLRARRR